MYFRIKVSSWFKVVTGVIMQFFLVSNFSFAAGQLNSTNNEYNTLSPNLRVNNVEFEQIISNITSSKSLEQEMLGDLKVREILRTIILRLPVEGFMQNIRALTDKIEFFVGKKAAAITIAALDSGVIPLIEFEKSGKEIKNGEKINLHFSDNSRLQIILDDVDSIARIYAEAQTGKDRFTLVKATRMAFDKNDALSSSELLLKLAQENFDERVRGLFGKSLEEALILDPYLARIGFDGKANRLGWSRQKINWLIGTDEGRLALQQTIDDGMKIANKYKYVIFAGMGGSGLSVEFVKKTFGEKGTKIYSLRTTDPQAIKAILDEIADLEGSEKRALENTLVIPVSKSGTTKETVSHKDYFAELYEKHSIDIKGHMWVVTDKGSPFDTGDYEQREIQLNGKGDIGGRYTAPATNVFLLPLAIVAPKRVKSILKISRTMNDNETKNDIFLQLGAFLYEMAAYKGKDKLTLIVPKELGYLPNWFEQLLEESLGKDGKGVTLFYEEDISPKALKAVDENDRVFLRLGFTNDGNQGLWEHIKSKGYPTFQIYMADLNSVGGVMLGLERTVAAIAYLWDICFVDQPAVEGYKQGTREVMDLAEKTGKPVTIPSDWLDYSVYNSLTLYYSPLVNAGLLTKKEIEQELSKIGMGIEIDNAPAVYAAILNILKRKPGFEAAEIMSYGLMSDDIRKTLQNARTKIFTQGMKMPTKLGEGPDKNHSFHQNIEGGKDMWLSTYIMAENFEQPQTLAYDDSLIKAQTIGTVKALMKAGRKAVLITANSDKGVDDTDVWLFFVDVNEYIEALEKAYIDYESTDRAKYRHVGISMGGDKVAISINDGNNNIIDHTEIRWNDAFGKGKVVEADPEDIMGLVAEGINNLLEINNILAGKINKVSVNLPGSIHKEKGIFGYEMPVQNLPFGSKYPFRAAFKQKLSDYGIYPDVPMVNDAEGSLNGETYSPRGLLKDHENGGVSIIGGGMNSAVKKDGKPYFGLKDEIKEIGHNVIRINVDSGFHYKFVGKNTLGSHPIEIGSGTEHTVKKSGDIGSEYVANADKFKEEHPDYPIIDLSKGESDFEDRISGPSIDTRLQEAGLGEDYTVKTLTAKAAAGDQVAVEWIEKIGREIGQAHAALFAEYAEEEFIKHWILISGVNENLGKGVYEEGQKEDIFISSIKQALIAELIFYFGMDESRALEIAAGIARSQMTYERELISYHPTDADISAVSNVFDTFKQNRIINEEKTLNSFERSI